MGVRTVSSSGNVVPITGSHAVDQSKNIDGAAELLNPIFPDVRAAQEALYRIRGDGVPGVSRLHRPTSDPIAQAKAQAVLDAFAALLFRTPDSSKPS